MIKLYLKQSWMLIRQNKLFSSLYVLGTGLAIAMTMIIAIVYYTSNPQLSSSASFLRLNVLSSLN